MANCDSTIIVQDTETKSICCRYHVECTWKGIYTLIYKNVKLFACFASLDALNVRFDSV